MNKKNNINIETMKKVLEKFRFSKPVPDELKKISWKDSRKKEIEILKEAGKYRPVYGAFLFVFYLTANFGFRLTVPQSAVVLVFTSVLALGSVSSGTYAVVQYFSKVDPVIEKPALEKAVNTAPVIPVKPKPVKANPFTLNIAIKGIGVENTIPAKITAKLKGHFANNNISINKKFVVKGEIAFLEGDYYGKIAVFDRKTVKQVFLKRKTVKSIDDLYLFFLSESKTFAQKMKE
ncbi:MAG: hypothetical protein GY754_45955 [bacterium]|nr:hypothetical protein [bacterium]